MEISDCLTQIVTVLKLRRNSNWGFLPYYILLTTPKMVLQAGAIISVLLCINLWTCSVWGTGQRKGKKANPLIYIVY